MNFRIVDIYRDDCATEMFEEYWGKDVKVDSLKVGDILIMELERQILPLGDILRIHNMGDVTEVTCHNSVVTLQNI